MCSSTPCPVPNRTRLAFRSVFASRVQVTPARSSAVAATSLRFTEFFGLAMFPSPTSRRHVQEADGITEGFDRVAHSGITREHRPGLGFNVLISSREPDAAFVDAQRHRTRCGVLIEPVTLLHYQQHHVQALALAQCDRVSPTLLPRLLLAQAGDSAAKLKLCSGPCNGLSDSGCGLVVIFYPPSTLYTAAPERGSPVPGPGRAPASHVVDHPAD